MATHTVLIIGKEEDIRDVVRLTLELSLDVHAVECASAEQALGILTNNARVSLIVCDSELTDKNAFEFYQCLSESHAKLPFFLLSNSAPVEDLPKSAYFSLIDRTNFLEPLTEMAKKHLNSHDSAEFGTSERSAEFVPLRLSLLLRVGSIGYDLYLKMSDRKFVKVFRPDDEFETLDSARFKEKNVQRLYLKYNDAIAFLREFATIVAASTEADNLGSDLGFELSQATNEIILSIAKSFGWSDEVQLLSKRNVKLALHLAKKHKTVRGLLQQRLIDKDDYLASHCMLIAHIACGLALKLKWNSKFTLFKISVASILHDLTLTDSEIERIFELDQRVLRPEFSNEPDVKKYKRHPKETADIVADFRQMPPEVNTIILQHHERPDGSGFPEGINHHRMNPVAILFIFSEDLVNYLFDIDGVDLAVEQFLMDRREIYSLGAFKKLYDIVRSQFADPKQRGDRVA